MLDTKMYSTLSEDNDDLMKEDIPAISISDSHSVIEQHHVDADHLSQSVTMIDTTEATEIHFTALRGM